MSHWIKSTTIDPNQPILFVTFLAAEPQSIDHLTAMFHGIIAQCDHAALDASIIGDLFHLLVLPARHAIGDHLPDAEPAIFLDHWAAMEEVVTAHAGAAAVNLYGMTDGMRFDGSPEARDWLRSHGYGAFSHLGATHDLADGPLAGNLLDPFELHPANDVAAGFLASLIIDAWNSVGDVDGDGSLSINDLLIIVGCWQRACPHADLNGDGAVSVPDLLEFLDRWPPV